MQPYNDQQSYQVPTPSDSSLPATYSGNQKDMTAFLAMVAGAMLIATSCVPGAACVLPIFAFVAGIIGLRGADRADRVRDQADQPRPAGARPGTAVCRRGARVRQPGHRHGRAWLRFLLRHRVPR